ncbi:hypothetical protein ACHHYP_14690, partial [Achlya hypogyna]
ELLLNNGADVVQTTNKGSTAHGIAREKGHIAIATHLERLYNSQRFLNAADAGETDVVAQLISAGVDVNMRNSNEQTPLLRAAWHGHDGTVSRLLAAGATVDAISNTGSTAFFMAAQDGHESTVRILLAAGASVHITKNDGTTAISAAAQYGHTAVVRQLIAAGANVNRADNDGFTPLFVAAQNGHLAAVQALLAAGADANLATKKGALPRGVAQKNGHTAIVDLLDNAIRPGQLLQAASDGDLTLVAQLLKKGASPNETNKIGFTALHLAAGRGHGTIVSHLVAGGANVNAIAANGQSPLHSAAASGKASIAQFLLEAHATVDLHDKTGQTPLHLAVLRDHEFVVQALLAAGADLCRRNNDNQTPEMLAQSATMRELLVKCRPNNAERPVQPPVEPQAEPPVVPSVPKAYSSAPTDLEMLQAVRNLQEVRVKKLLEKGGNPNAADEVGDTLVHLAVRNNQRALLDLLLRARGIDAVKRNNDRDTPLTLAIKLGHRRLAQRLYAAVHEPTYDVRPIWICELGRIGPQVAPNELVVDKSATIGQGSFGAVYKGTFRGAPVAVKTVFDANRAAALVYEMEAMQLCNSPYVLELIAVAGAHTDNPQLVLEYMDGGDLRQYLDKKSKGQPTSTTYSALDVAWVLANALADLHHNGLLHRDLKSLNVLLSSTNYIKLGDLGLTREYATQMTTGTGTPYWTAPEVLTSGESYSYAADIYSFGVILTELDTLQPPFADLKIGMWAILDQVRQGTLRPSVSATCAPWLAQLAADCMAYDPALRPTAQAIVDMLQHQRHGKPWVPKVSKGVAAGSPSASTVSTVASTVSMASTAPSTPMSSVQSAATGSGTLSTGSSKSYSSWSTSTLVSTTMVCALCKTSNSVLAVTCGNCGAATAADATKLKALLKRIAVAKKRGMDIDPSLPCVVCDTNNDMTAVVCEECEDDLPDDGFKLKILVAIVDRATKAAEAV